MQAARHFRENRDIPSNLHWMGFTGAGEIQDCFVQKGSEPGHHLWSVGQNFYGSFREKFLLRKAQIPLGSSRLNATRSTCRAVLFDQLDTAKMHALDKSNVSCRDVRAKWNLGFTQIAVMADHIPKLFFVAWLGQVLGTNPLQYPAECHPIAPECGSTTKVVKAWLQTTFF